MSEYIIDRKTARDLFQDLLNVQHDNRILWLHGGGKMGKTRLIKMFHQQAHKQAKIACAHVQLESQYSTVNSVLTQLKRQLGAHKFPAYNNLIAEHAKERHKIDLKDIDVADHSKLFVQTGSDDHTTHMRQTALTDAFLDDVARLTKQQRTLFLFDALEKSSAAIQHWVQDHLLLGLHQIEQTLIVMAGRNAPNLCPPWEFDCIAHQLQPVTLQDYAEFCTKISWTIGSETIETLHRLYDGSPGAFFEAYVTLTRQQGRV